MRYFVIAVMLLTGCRSTLAPEVPASSSRRPQVDRADRSHTVPDQVPALRNLEVLVWRGELVVRASLAHPSPYYLPRYGNVPGGWVLQMFLDADSDRATGYGRGWEYVVRGSEFADGEMPVRETEPHHDDLPGSGGFSVVVGYAPTLVTPGRVEFRVPLSAIQDEGMLNWRIETYSVVLNDAGYPSGRFLAAYNGATDD